MSFIDFDFRFEFIFIDFSFELHLLYINIHQSIFLIFEYMNRNDEFFKLIACLFKLWCIRIFVVELWLHVGGYILFVLIYLIQACHFWNRKKKKILILSYSSSSSIKILKIFLENHYHCG
ncbi:hypothetical protein DERF_006628 [Dermatophagoides farinae]|uniref:Transmembrane protein n=1 Tax=Dermatophagoides farinae TaxID=6954 RepID=A0A922HXN3_DERFA|nr:hypothetical protein DERF_006628 [Dermatophagoides farinae]